MTLQSNYTVINAPCFENSRMIRSRESITPAWKFLNAPAFGFTNPGPLNS